MSFDFEGRADLLEFDLEFTSLAGAEGLLAFYLDGLLIGTIDERFALSGNETYRWLLDVTDPGIHELAFRLDPFTTTPSSVSISNIRFSFDSTVVPEPNGLLLWICGVALLLCCTRERVRQTNAIPRE